MLFTAFNRLYANNIKIEPETRLLRIEHPAEGADPRWIRSESEISAVFPVALESLRAVLEDYDSYPDFFPRLVRTAVSAKADGAVAIKQRYEVNILGYRYPTEYSVDLRPDEAELPRRWVLSWTLAGSDGTIGDSSGDWTLESVGSFEAPSTRMTHRNRSLIKKVFPFQDMVMRQIAERELTRSLFSVYVEAKSREGEVLDLALLVP